VNGLTLFLAVWGAVVSSVAVGWNIFTALRDKGRLKVEVSITRIVGDKKRTPHLSITITNVGRRPVYVTNVGGRLKKGTDAKFPNFWFKTTGIPKMLKEAEYHMEVHPFVKEQHCKIDDFYVYTSASDCFKLSRKVRKHLLKDISDTIVELESGKEPDGFHMG
jgi:hypothetical protein